MTYNGAFLSSSNPNVLDWLDKHGFCHPARGAVVLGGTTGFSLHTEDAIPENLAPAKQNADPP